MTERIVLTGFGATSRRDGQLGTLVGCDPNMCVVRLDADGAILLVQRNEFSFTCNGETMCEHV